MNSLNGLTWPPVRPLSDLLPNSYAVNTPALPPVGMQWIDVRQRFQQFNRNLSLMLRQSVDGTTKRNGVVNCLNRHYYGSTSDTDHSFLIGSWGKPTAMRPPRDVDLYFVLAYAVYSQFQGHSWNRQSALLQEVKDVLADTYPEPYR
jgi:hypothetical protein